MVKLKLNSKPPFVHLGQNQNHNNGSLLLPEGPRIDDSTDEERNLTLTAQKLLGIRVRSHTVNKTQLAGFVGQASQVTNVVAIHTTDEHLQPYVYTFTEKETGANMEAAVPGLFEIARHGHYDYTLYLGAYQPDLTTHNNQLDSLKLRVNPTNVEYYNAIQSWVRSLSSASGVARHLWIVGPSWAVAPAGDELMKASVGGRIVDFGTAGSTLHSLIHRRPARFQEVFPLYNGSREHERYAFPHRQLIKREDYLRIGRTAFAYWAYGQINNEVFSKLLRKNLDILLRVELVSGTDKAYFTACLRTAVDIKDLGLLSQIDSELYDIGNFTRVTGPDLDDAWFAYTFSRPLPRKFYRHSVPGWTEVKLEDIQGSRDGIFALAANSLAPVGDPQGYVVLGVNNGVVYLVDPSLMPAWLYTGESKRAGKSTTIPFHAFQETPDVIWVDLTASKMDSPRKWVRDFGSEPIVLDLPDADTMLTDAGNRSSKEEVRAYQEKLHLDDIDDARKKARQLFAKWEKAGKITGLPLTFSLKSGNTIRYLNWLDQFLQALKEGMKDWHAKTGQYLILVVDNFSHLKEQQSDHAVLDDLPWKIAVNLAKTIAWFINQGANHGIRVRVATHDKDDFKSLVGDMYKSFSLHIGLGDKTHTAEVKIPRTGELEARVNMHLPASLLQFTERLDPAQIRELEKLEKE